jgi:hypothetical protein
MYNEQIPDPSQELLNARLDRIKSELRTLYAPTREDYQVAVYGKVNAVLNLANSMQPLKPVSAESPAIVGDLTENFKRLNQDATDVARVLVTAEDAAARLFNLAASVQNGLRQQVRELAYGSNAWRYVEPFLTDKNIDQNSGTIDFVTGAAYLKAAEEIVKSATVAAGANSVGAISDIDALTDNDTETRMTFDGTTLELIVTFAQPEIINRLRIEMDDYEGLELTDLTSSPDGTVFDDVLADLRVRHMVLNGASGKLSGEVVLDFPPRHVKQFRLVINDRVGAARIAFRGLTFYRRSYTAQTELVTKLISAPMGESVKFTADADTWGAFTTITHQVSTNGVHYTTIKPGDVLTLKQPFMYKATLQRVQQAFSDAASPVSNNGADPNHSEDYRLRSTSTVKIGSNFIERTIVFDTVSGPVTLKETPIPGTFNVLEGAVPLSESDYTFSGGVLSFPTEKYNITVTYQTSSLGNAALAERQPYYSPVLREVRFERLK